MDVTMAMVHTGAMLIGYFALGLLLWGVIRALIHVGWAFCATVSLHRFFLAAARKNKRQVRPERLFRSFLHHWGDFCFLSPGSKTIMGPAGVWEGIGNWYLRGEHGNCK